MKTNPLRDHDAAISPLTAAGFDEADPHGFAGKQSHHHHVSRGMLRFVLGILLAFTLLTVAAAQLELWVQDYFDIRLPMWVNVVVAMSIAVVKGTLVALYFMQLKYDNPINGVVMLVTLLAVGLFLGFTIIDLGFRDTVYTYKAGQVIPGGTSYTLTRKDKDGKEAMTNAMSLAVNVREMKIKELGELEYARLGLSIADERERIKKVMELGAGQYARLEADAHAHAHGHHAAHEVLVSSPEHSRPKRGLSGALSLAPTPATGHDAGHHDVPAGHAEGAEHHNPADPLNVEEDPTAAQPLAVPDATESGHGGNPLQPR